MTGPVPVVLLVTGAYHPQISSSAIQCRAIARALARRVKFVVLTTATDPGLPLCERIDDVPVYRVFVGPGVSRLRQLAALTRQYLRAAAEADMIHVHGVSTKNTVVATLSALTRKPLILTLHTSGEDEPDVIRRKGRAAWWSFRRAARVVSVSPYLTERYLSAGLPEDRLLNIPNGIDIERFHPPSEDERDRLKAELGFPRGVPLILFVGFFSHDKRPDFLFDAWSRIQSAHRSTLAFVGATGPTYREIDPGLIDVIRARATDAGLAGSVHFVGPVREIEKYYRAADCYVLSSRREAAPIALLEAMACAVPAIATRLAGVTDRLITDRVDGLLFDVESRDALTKAIDQVLADERLAGQIGAAARRTVVDRFAIDAIAKQWDQLYRSVVA